MVRCRSGCATCGASWARGSSTNVRSCIRGCGRVSRGSFTTRSPYSNRSRSIGRGPHRTVEGRRGYEPRILGRATWDSKEGRFTAFEMVAAGPRWGGTTYNVRRDDPGPEPMGIFFRLAETSEGPDRVAPAHAWNYFGK